MAQVSIQYTMTHKLLIYIYIWLHYWSYADDLSLMSCRHMTNSVAKDIYKQIGEIRTIG